MVNPYDPNRLIKQEENDTNKFETERQSGDPFFDGNEDINDQAGMFEGDDLKDD